MTDLPAQLRERAGMLMQETRFDSGSPWTSDLLREAADEIERLRKIIEAVDFQAKYVRCEAGVCDHEDCTKVGILNDDDNA